MQLGFSIKRKIIRAVASYCKSISLHKKPKTSAQLRKLRRPAPFLANQTFGKFKAKLLGFKMTGWMISLLIVACLLFSLYLEALTGKSK